MESEALTVPEAQQPENKGCIACGHPIVVEGYPNRLCESCREKLIRYPVPKWIWLFGAGVLVLLLLSLSRLPANFSAALHFEKGKKAETDHRYMTAYREFAAVNRRFPDLIEPKTHMAIAAYMNYDLASFARLTSELSDKNIEDADVFSELNTMVGKVGDYLPHDPFDSYFSRYEKAGDIPDSAYVNFHRLHPDDCYALFQHIGNLYNDNKDAEADTLLNGLMDRIPSFPGFLYTKSGIKRQLQQFDSSLYFLQQLEFMNRENSFVYASRARTYLKQKKDQQAWEEVMKAKSLDPNDGYVLATLALAHHFRNEITERDRLIAASAKDSTASEYMQYIRDIVSGKVKFRD